MSGEDHKRGRLHAQDEQERLRELREEREKAQYEYNKFRQMISDNNDYEEAKRRRVERLLERKEIVSDPRVRELYEEKTEKARQFQLKGEELYQVSESEWETLVK